ncbi:uncharacterized protein LOC123556765 [Mercenaria mercenaria]|uniref:uncharacterized protein LOC123556765 n=1 Tax=Mercenaria mercenaria TaxID=6596 RepID=UPI00234FAB57|nr:uncharacterized protein LOC123556765 [Mercenaria mercenaria]
MTGYEEEIKTRKKNQEEQAKEIERLRQFEAVHPALKDQLAELENRLSQSESGKFETEDKLMQAENEKRQLGEEKQKLLLRLSKLAGAKLTLDNPNIADLSDQKRPTKLAEEFAELYDNEWTDAFEDVQTEDERETASFMLDLLKRANELCHQVSDEHMNKIKTSICKLTISVNDPFGRQPKEHHAQPVNNVSDKKEKAVALHVEETSSSNGNTSREHAEPHGPSVLAPQDTDIEQKQNLEDVAGDKYEVTDKIEQLCDKDKYEKSLQTEEMHEVIYDFNTFPTDGKKTIMELRKFVEVTLSDRFETIATDVISRKSRIYNNPQNKVLKYIAKCVNICWSMCRQEPTVKIDFPEEQGDMHFDTGVYKAYTKSGRLIDYIVWPAVYLHENGPLLCKGVAQGKNGNKN